MALERRQNLLGHVSWLAELSLKTEKEKKFVNCTEVGIPFLALPSVTESTGYRGPYLRNSKPFSGNGLTLLFLLRQCIQSASDKWLFPHPQDPNIKQRPASVRNVKRLRPLATALFVTAADSCMCRDVFISLSSIWNWLYKNTTILPN